MCVDKKQDLLDFLLEDDEMFYERYLLKLTEEEYERFLKENPDFSIRAKR